jgi:hypothetical protein
MQKLTFELKRNSLAEPVTVTLGGTKQESQEFGLVEQVRCKPEKSQD